MFADNSIHGSETDSSAFEFFCAMEALENPEEFIHIFHVEADAIITNEDGVPAISFGRAHLDDGFLTGPGVLNGVGEEIGKDLLHQAGIALDRGQLAYVPLDVAPFSF